MTAYKSPALPFIVAFCMICSPAFTQDLIPIPTPRPAYNPLNSAADTGALKQSYKKSVLAGTRLTLADAVFLGLRTNRSIKSAYIDRVAEKFNLRVAEDRFTPHFGISGTISRQKIGDVTSTTVDVSPGVSLLTKTGATFEFGWNNAAVLDGTSRSLTSTADISIEQPLLRGAGVEINMAPLRSARLQEQINQLRLKATVSETIGGIIFAHRDLLLAQEELKLAEEAVGRSEELLTINRALIGAGRMAEMDAVQTEADVESQKLRVLRARQHIETTRLALVDLLGLDLATKLVAVETLTPRRIPVDTDNLILTALANRQDYQGQLYAVEQSRLGLTVAKNEQLWDIALFARGRLGGAFVSALPSDNIGDVTAGLRFNLPINDLARQQLLVEADTSYRNVELQLAVIRSGVELQVRGSASEATLLWQQLIIAERSRSLAAKAVEIEKLKLNAGRSTTFQVRSLEDSLRSSEIQLLAARVGYLNALTRLDLQLGTTLDTWRISLKD